MDSMLGWERIRVGMEHKMACRYQHDIMLIKADFVNRNEKAGSHLGSRLGVDCVVCRREQ